MSTVWRRRYADWLHAVGTALRAAGILLALLLLLTLVGLTNATPPGTMAIPGVFATTSSR